MVKYITNLKNRFLTMLVWLEKFPFSLRFTVRQYLFVQNKNSEDFSDHTDSKEKANFQIGDSNEKYWSKGIVSLNSQNLTAHGIFFLFFFLIGPLEGSSPDPSFSQSRIFVSREKQEFTFEIEGELLMQKMFATSLDYLSTGVGGSATNTLQGAGTVYNFQSDYQFGYKVSATCYFSKDNLMDVSAQYAWFGTHGGSCFSNSLVNPVRVLPFLLPVLGTTTIHSASLNAKFDLNRVDLIGGYSFPLFFYLNFRCFAGLTGLWNDLKVKVGYKYFTTAAPSGEERALLNSKMNAWGIGPVTGFEMNWNLTNYINIFGSFAFRVPWIWQNEKAFERITRLTSVVSPNQFDLMRSRFSSGTLAFTWDFLLGPRINFWINDNCHGSLRAAWQWEIMSGDYWVYLTSSGDNSNVQAEIQGLNISASIEF